MTDAPPKFALELLPGDLCGVARDCYPRSTIDIHKHYYMTHYAPFMFLAA